MKKADGGGAKTANLKIKRGYYGSRPEAQPMIRVNSKFTFLKVAENPTTFYQKLHQNNKPYLLFYFKKSKGKKKYIQTKKGKYLPSALIDTACFFRSL